MNERYYHRQFGTQMVAVLALVGATVACVEYFSGLHAVFAVVVFTLAALIAIFSTMTITVSDGELAWWMTFGLFKQRVRVADIDALEEYRVGLLSGLGVRTNNGRDWMWIVSGPSAATFRLTTGRSVTLGSDDVDNLLAAVNRARTDD